MGTVSRSIKSEIHFRDSEHHNATFSLHKETLSGRESRDFADAYSPDTLIVQFFKSEHLVEIAIEFSFDKFQEFFGCSPDNIETEYVFEGEVVHERYDPDRIVIEDYDSDFGLDFNSGFQSDSNSDVKDLFDLEFDNGYEVKPSSHYSGRELCGCCDRRRPDFMITNGPEYIYLDEECFKRMQAVYDVIREVNSDYITGRLI